MKEVYFCPRYTDRQGISVSFTKKTSRIKISGWYDSMVGIEGEEMSLYEFFSRVGVSELDCLRAFKHAPNRPGVNRDSAV
jgi:hypothetical protein